QKPPITVKQTYFTSKTEANGNLLQWETTEEVNSEKFVVQRSQNAVNFNDIFTVETGSDSNEPKRYSYLDDSPVFGTNYYRLKQIDIDGSMSFSKIVAAKWDFQSEIIFPNPVTDKRFVIDGVSGEIIRAILSDINNRSIPVKLDKSGESVTATLAESMASGVYFLQIQTSTKSISKKIVVQ
ncbi:MAG: T9SS type A sorting domain-containing protein, partial [Spirosomaceae bacterium]|nr:T9SS type A sorting domain-containing protein [Spirosomataceae bacterium]